MIERLQIYKDKMNKINQKQSRILELKTYLNATDYHILKKEEGYEIPQEILTERAKARVEINQLEAEILILEQETEPIPELNETN